MIRVQEIDERLARLRREAQDIPARKERARSRLAEREAAFARAEAACQQELAEIQRLEKEVEAARATAARLRQQQFEVKTNDAYRALLHEIDTLTAHIRQLEDAELERMENVERYQRALAATRRDLDSESATVERECAELDGRLATMDSELARAEAERTAAAGEVDPDWLRRYERIRDHVGTLALAPVDHGTCGGCHMRLPPQAVHDARRCEQIAVCAFCGRMLYSIEALA